MPDKKISCFAVDDEPIALHAIEKYILATPMLDLVGTCNNAVEAMSSIQNNKVDLLFLDIQMPQIFGTDFMRTLTHPPRVIFTTAFRRYAVDGFELDAVDYLLKPISFERFLKAVNKVLSQNIHSPAQIVYPVSQKENIEKYLFIRADRKNIKVNFEDILFIESLKDYVKVVTIERSILTKQAISNIEKLLPKELFARTHRSFIVSIDKINSYSQDLIQIHKQEIPIGRSYRFALEMVLKK
ncbi:MAG: DNA-binding response regulator [Bacteroidetes bacterium]|nr:MAG: DNA-binding response regulator [Bacteroidota bacterium]